MKAFYAGEWRFDGPVKKVRNPFDESVIGEVPDLEPEILDLAIDGLSNGCEELKNMSRETHHAIFRNLLEILKSNRNELVGLLQIEQGKPVYEARMEWDSMIQSIEVLADNASLIGQEIQPLAAEPASRGWSGFTIRQPHGIVGILTPVVYPLLFPIIHVCYALAAGNSVILKPARVTPLIALRLVELLLEAGVPPTAIACITGRGNVLGKALCADKRLNHLCCMGRIPTIKSIRNNASFVPAHLQWGCVSTVIADRSADVERLVRSYLRAAYDNAGQSAFTASLIAAEPEVYDVLCDRLSAAVAGIKTGNPLNDATQMGPVSSAVSRSTFDKVLAHEKENGAEVLVGGTREGRRILPTLLRNCDPEKSILSREEVRAPVSGITKIRKKEDIIGILQKQRYHILTLFTGETGAAVNQASNLPFENIHINGIPTWRDGLICVPGQPPRSGLRDSYDRIKDYCRYRDIVCHPG